MAKENLELSKKISTKDIILTYLRQNRGREIPISEIRDKHSIKRTTVSNAIKELKLLGKINIERRSLKHGRYTIIWLIGDTINEFYTHPDEVKSEELKSEVENVEIPYKFDNLEETMQYLMSHHYEHSSFLTEIIELNLSKFDLVANYIQPLLFNVGVKWEQSLITTGQEHLITNRIEKLIYDIIPKTPEQDYKGTILLCVVEGENHQLILLLLELLLSDQYKTINLGRSMPIRSLIQFITDLEERIDWIFISITLSIYFGTLKRQIKAIQSVFQDEYKIAIGGQGIAVNDPELQHLDYVITDSKAMKGFVKYLRNE